MIRRRIETATYIGSRQWTAKLNCGHTVTWVAKTGRVPHTAECDQCISFKVSAADRSFIARIVDRAVADAAVHGVSLNRQTVDMDVTACHANGCALRLQDLLEARPFDFAHDITGISKNMDRTTGRLLNLFEPRFAQ